MASYEAMGGGGSRKTQKIRTPIVIFNEIILSKPGSRRGKWGLKILIFAPMEISIPKGLT